MTSKADLTCRRVPTEHYNDQGNGYAKHLRAALRDRTRTLLAGQTLAAADLNIWWNKSYYPEEDEQFDEIVAEFEKAKRARRRVPILHQRGRTKKVLAALTAGEPPDLAYGFLFDLQHTARWAMNGMLEDVSDVVEESSRSPATPSKP